MIRDSDLLIWVTLSIVTAKHSRLVVVACGTTGHGAAIEYGQIRRIILTCTEGTHGDIVRHEKNRPWAI